MLGVRVPRRLPSFILPPAFWHIYKALVFQGKISMSDNKDNLEQQTQVASPPKKTPEPTVVSKESVVDVAKKHSAKDILLWLIAVGCLISATLAPDYLSGHWTVASDVWVRIAITAGLVVVALVCLAFTHQGGAFKTLLKDAGVELRRITWPSKNETVTYTWQVIVVTIIVGILVWLLDNFFNYVVGFILG